MEFILHAASSQLSAPPHCSAVGTRLTLDRAGCIRRTFQHEKIFNFKLQFHDQWSTIKVKIMWYDVCGEIFPPELFPNERLEHLQGNSALLKNTPPSCLPPSLSHSFDNKLLTASISAHLLLTDFCGGDVAARSLCGPRRNCARPFFWELSLKHTCLSALKLHRRAGSRNLDLLALCFFLFI